MPHRSGPRASAPVPLLALLLAAFAAGCGSTTVVRNDVPLSVETRPAPVPTADGTLVEYELLVWKYAQLGLRATRVEVRSGAIDGPVLKTYQGDEISRFVVPPPHGTPDHAVVLVGFFLPAGAATPTSLSHVVSFADGTRAEGGVATLATGPVLSIAPPVSGDRWWMGNGPTTDALYHRNAVWSFSGKTYASERFAIDFIRLGDDGRAYAGDGSSPGDWVSHGADLLAVADGTIVDVRDGVPEQATPLGPNTVPVTMENLGGNYVVLDVGDRHEAFAFYGHAIPGSIRVRIGDHVTVGQVLASLGNSGNSSAPHLHFHVCDGNGPMGTRDESLFCNGLPYALPAFDVLGSASFDDVVDGVPWTPSGPPSPRAGELPLRDAVLSFPVP